jgi:exosortase
MRPKATIGPPAQRTVVLAHWGGLRSFALLAGLIGLAFAYHPTLMTLLQVWSDNPNYSHGFLVPPVTAYLLWQQRSRFADPKEGGSWMGLLLLVPAALLQIVGLRGEVATIQGFSLILAIGGLVWQLWGGRVLRAVAFPIAFLIFMIPALPWFMNVLSFQLKIFAAQAAVAAAHGMGVAVQREGVNLLFPEGVLSVENACSGLRSLVALMALGALFAYYSVGPISHRIALFALAMPIAVAANVIRVTSLCVYAGIAGTEAAAGLFHKLGSYALFAIAFLMLAACKKVLRC